ncbi:MAG: 2-oxoacid:acceptor oxidoreductase family protein [Candidatus Paceibacterota bacterium]
MEKTVLFAGKAGQGVDRTAVLLSKILFLSGYQCFVYRDYSSLIRGGHNFSIVTFSKKKVRSHKNIADILVALDKGSYDMHRKKLKEGGRVFSFEKTGRDSVLIERPEMENISNNALLGALVAYLDVPFSAGIQIIKKEFPRSNKAVIDIFRKGYELLGKPIDADLKNKLFTEGFILDGSEAVAKGAIDAGVQDVFYYPMTPATGAFSKLEEIASPGVNVFQMEDEIAAANAALGASYAGKTAFTGSSGGGMALMGEVASFAGMAELPIVFYAAQRMGPSTGVPTYTSQGDIKAIINLGPGEFPKMVLVPGDIEEAYKVTGQAFYFARKYRMPVFILSDKHIAESYTNVGDFSPEFSKSNFIKNNPGESYKSYKITESGVSPAIQPGGPAVFRVTSYEHDEEGYTTEDSEQVKTMNDKRLRKMDSVKKELSNKHSGISVYGRGKKVIIFSGSPKGAVLDALPLLRDWGAIQINRLYPFPTDELKKKIKNKIFITVENNATSLLADLIKESCGTDIKGSILKYNGRPFTAEEILEEVLKF